MLAATELVAARPRTSLQPRWDRLATLLRPLRSVEIVSRGETERQSGCNACMTEALRGSFEGLIEIYEYICFCSVESKIEKIPRDIKGEKLVKDMAMSGKLVSTTSA